MRMRDELGVFYQDAPFIALFTACGQSVEIEVVYRQH